jgi:hypothetical protein
MTSRTGVIVLSVAVACSLLFDGALHAVVPHGHHGGDAIWQGLHAALQHEQKALVAVAFFSLFMVPIVMAAPIRPTYALAPRGRRERLLEKGIEKYRRFG